MKIERETPLERSDGRQGKVRKKEPVDLDYRQLHIMGFLKDRPAISWGTIENTCKIPTDTIRHFMKGRRNLPEKYFDSLKDELFKYGYTALDSE